MSPWTALLESVHSALIDELTDRHPEPKPTLGMPQRLSQWQAPASATRLLLTEAAFDAQRGILALGFEDGFMKALSIDPETLWSAILKRAGSEFMRRSIRPTLATARETKPTDPLPSGFPDPQRIVWIPFEIPGGRCYLGLGA